MKKKLLLVLFVILLMFTVTGCVSKKKENNKKEEETKEDTEGKLIINGYDLTLNEESSFSKIKFKYPHDAIISNPITSLIMDYKKKDSDEYLVRVVMGDMYGTNIESSMNGFTKVGTKTINGIEWGVYTANGKTSYGFNINYSNIVIGFMYEDPALEKFEEEFMNNVTLNIEEE